MMEAKRRPMIRFLLYSTLDTEIDKKFIKNYKINLFGLNFDRLCLEVGQIQN